jgi:predicted metalloprotease with PDZ domain
MPRSTLLARLLLAACALALGYAPARALETAYTVTLNRPWQHLIEVELRVTGLTPGKPTELVLPVWTPGSYMVREYARHVQEFEAATGDGTALPWRKTRKNVWRVESGARAGFVARYKVYANELTVRTNEFNDSHAFINNSALLFHVGGALNTPSTLKVVPPAGWKVATGLDPVPGAANTFKSPDVDTLYDCPVLAGNLTEIPFTVKGIPHRVVLDGQADIDTEKLRDGVKAIVEAQAAFFGGDLPYTNYTFLTMIRPGFGGGLEHKNSTALGASPDDFEGEYTGFFSLVSHEFFHLWNVKRIKPDALGPFDYGNENYTRLLWVAEGITSYYENVFLRRAGLITEQQFRVLSSLPIRATEGTPGRKRVSLEEASFDTWIKEYRPDENTVNTTISYYTKGALVGLLLDLTIRAKTANAKSLDDVMRILWTEYAKADKNYTPEDFQKVCERVAGGTLDPFFAKYVRGRDEIDYDAVLAPAGLRLIRTAGGGNATAYLGARYATDPAGVRVSAVPADTPAYEQGISVGDVIIAVDDRRVTSGADVEARAAAKQPGDTVRVTLFRADALRVLPIKLGGRERAIYQLVTAENLTSAQRTLLRDWARGSGN